MYSKRLIRQQRKHQNASRPDRFATNYTIDRLIYSTGSLIAKPSILLVNSVSEGELIDSSSKTY